MIPIQDLPTVNAILNATAAVLLMLGRRAIKQGKSRTHKQYMVSAVAVSAVFLVSYLSYHYLSGHTVYQGTGVMRVLYFVILIPHILLAMAMLPFILAALWYAHQADIENHKNIVRWLWPVWMYVSVTGVLVYLMLYVF